jgi:hypothetical protein
MANPYDRLKKYFDSTESVACICYNYGVGKEWDKKFDIEMLRFVYGLLYRTGGVK